MKLTALLSLLAASSASAFVAPGPSAVRTSALHATSDAQKFANTATVAAATVATTLATSPLAALAEDDDYVYGAVAAPGGIGLAVGLGVVAIITAAVPVILAPGEDAFNEMKENEGNTFGTGKSPLNRRK